MKIDNTEWVLVPRVATEEMIEAGEDDFDHGVDDWKADSCYEAMLAAAPQPPVEEMVKWFANIMAEDTTPDLGWDWASPDAKAIYLSNARAIVRKLVGEG